LVDKAKYELRYSSRYASHVSKEKGSPGIVLDKKCGRDPFILGINLGRGKEKFSG
jgi:hypothetical protein